MQAFLCYNCPLAFEIGGYAYWELDGDTDQLVCVDCGTMHRLDFRKSPDYPVGTTTFLALPEPTRKVLIVKRKSAFGDEFEDYEWPFKQQDWITVASWPNRLPLALLTCSYCHQSGSLISLETPQTADGSWPIFRDKEGNEHCPVCKGPIECLYDVTIN